MFYIYIYMFYKYSRSRGLRFGTYYLEAYIKTLVPSVL